MRGVTSRLTRGLALALSDNTLRSNVLASMNASPIGEGKLHLRSFLNNEGRGLRDRVISKLSIDSLGFGAILDSVIDFEFYMPVPEHREVWTGGDNLYVASALRDHEVNAAFDLSGHSVALSADEPPAMPTLVVVPVETNFDRTGTVGEGASSSQVTANSSITTDGVYMTFAQFDDDYEGWLMGSPEFEVHVFGDTTMPGYPYPFLLEHLICSGEGSGVQPLARRFNMDDEQGFYGDVLLYSYDELRQWTGQDTMNIPTEVSVWENDTGCQCGDTTCVDAPAGDQDAEDLIGGSLVIAVVLLTGEAPEDWFADLVLGGGALWFASGLFGGGGDDLVGALVPHCGVAVPWGSGNWTVRRGAYGHGGVVILNTLSTGASECPPPPLSVILGGATEGNPGDLCSWAASASGGDPPYSYAWSGIVSGGGSQKSANVSSSGWVYVTVTDAGTPHQSVTKSLYMLVDWSAQTCGFL